MDDQAETAVDLLHDRPCVRGGVPAQSQRPKPAKCLLCAIGTYRRQGAAMPGAHCVESSASLPSPDFPHQDAVRDEAETGYIVGLYDRRKDKVAMVGTNDLDDMMMDDY